MLALTTPSLRHGNLYPPVARFTSTWSVQNRAEELLLATQGGTVRRHFDPGLVIAAMEKPTVACAETGAPGRTSVPLLQTMKSVLVEVGKLRWRAPVLGEAQWSRWEREREILAKVGKRGFWACSTRLDVARTSVQAPCVVRSFRLPSRSWSHIGGKGAEFPDMTTVWSRAKGCVCLPEKRRDICFLSARVTPLWTGLAWSPTLRAAGAQQLFCDLCRYGARWRCICPLLLHYISPCDALRLSRTFSGAKGTCSASRALTVDHEHGTRVSFRTDAPTPLHPCSIRMRSTFICQW